MNMTETFPALMALRQHLAAAGGTLTAAEAPLVIDTLREYLRDGASLGRELRGDLAKFRPADPVAAAAAYLFVVTVDATTHANREGALQAYGQQDQPLAADARDLYALLIDPAFAQAKGLRPLVSRRTDGRGCGA